MLRFVFIIATSLILAVMSIHRLSAVASDNKYSEEQRYEEAMKVLKTLKRKGRITTDVYGTENLPKDGGYIMYSNHQGKYDAVGIISSHEKPLAVLMEYKKSKVILASQFIDAIGGKRIKFDDPRQQISVINEIANEVKNGRRYLIFPEGGYTDNRNHLQEFLTGCFKSAFKAECTIVPVCIVDSWKPFGINSLKKVNTQVHFLEAIPYEDYKDMRNADIAKVVKGRIADKMIEITGEC